MRLRSIFVQFDDPLVDLHPGRERTERCGEATRNGVTRLPRRDATTLLRIYATMCFGAC
ncbi:hypothetical protein ABIB66_000053 [Bradyrhizobium sp. F1.13.3]